VRGLAELFLKRNSDSQTDFSISEGKDFEIKKGIKPTREFLILKGI